MYFGRLFAHAKIGLFGVPPFGSIPPEQPRLRKRGYNGIAFLKNSKPIFVQKDTEFGGAAPTIPAAIEKCTSLYTFANFLQSKKYRFYIKIPPSVAVFGENMIKKQLPECDVELTVMLISDRWKILILRDLLTGTKRFGELKKSVSGISQKVLTAHLRSMEEDGLVNRKVYAQVPPRVDYSLTEKGFSLKPVLDSMAQWGKTYRSGF